MQVSVVGIKVSILQKFSNCKLFNSIKFIQIISFEFFGNRNMVSPEANLKRSSSPVGMGGNRPGDLPRACGLAWPI